MLKPTARIADAGRFFVAAPLPDIQPGATVQTPSMQASAGIQAKAVMNPEGA